MIEELFKNKFKIQRYTTTISNGISSKTYTDLSFAKNVSGLMRPLNSNEINAAQSQGYVANYRFYCLPFSSSLQITDRIVDTVNNENYEIKAIRNPMNFDEFLQIDCEIKY